MGLARNQVGNVGPKTLTLAEYIFEFSTKSLIRSKDIRKLEILLILIRNNKKHNNQTYYLDESRPPEGRPEDSSISIQMFRSRC